MKYFGGDMKPLLFAALLATTAVSKPVCKPGMAKEMGIVKIQLPLTLVLMRSHHEINTLRCNRDMTKPLQQALQCVASQGYESLVTGGCYCYRNIRGTKRLSKHAQGKAIDINPGSEVPDDVVHCFEQAGFEWGGRWNPADIMHFELKE